MSAIDDIRKQVVQHLLEQHYQAKERGEEFFFTVEMSDYHELPYMLGPHVDGGPTLKVLCYGRWARSPITYLLITDKKQVFLIGEFNDGHDPETDQVSYNLDQFFQHRMKQVRFIQGQNLNGAVLWVFELVEPANFAGKLDRFLNVIKPEIDELVKPIKISKFSYYFFNQKQFEEYLKNEPNYIPPVAGMRKELRLSSLRVQDFRGIKQAIISDLPKSARWIVLTGENGYGKTSVLQAIAAGLYGNYDESGRELVSETAFIGVEYYANSEVVETNSRAPRKESADKKLSNELATYGSSRLQVSASVTREMIEEQLPTTYHLFNTDGLLLSVEQLLKDTNIYNKPFYDQLVALFKALIPQLADIRIELVNKIPEVLYIEQDEARQPLTIGLPFGQLAAGFRNIIAMIGDLVYRLSTMEISGV